MNIISSMESNRPYVSLLPIEMLSAIFEVAPLFPQQRLQFALAVSQVSSLWRQSATRTPFLWSSVLLLGECGDGWLKLMKLMIKLSTSHPLDITFNIHLKADNANFHDIFNWQFDLIIPEISRWKRLFYLGNSYVDVWHCFEYLSSLSAPFLEVFEVQICTNAVFADNPHRVFEHGAPMLVQLSINGMKISCCLPPMLSITSLELLNPKETIDFVFFKEILTASSALTHIELHVDVVDEDELGECFAQGQSIELPSLRSLVLTTDIFPRTQLFNLLSVLHCPGLDKMSIGTYSSEDSSSDVRPRHSHELPVFHSLRSLLLVEVDCARLCADFDVTKLPALADITFHRCTTVMTLFSALVPTTEKNVDIWPLLQTISVDASSLQDNDVDRLCKVLSHRTQCGKPVDCVKLYITEAAFLANRRYWRQFREHAHFEIYTYL
jgi:hypothetical protein